VGLELTTMVVMSTDSIGSCNSNYHTIKTAPNFLSKIYICPNYSLLVTLFFRNINLKKRIH